MSDVNNNQEDSAKGELEKLHGEHSGQIRKSCEFFGYGILIGLFHFGSTFFHRYPYLACLTALFSILTLLSVYFFSAYQFARSESILVQNVEVKKKVNKEVNEINDRWLSVLYSHMRIRSKYIFWSFQVTLGISVLLFMWSSYLYFFCMCP